MDEHELPKDEVEHEIDHELPYAEKGIQLRYGVQFGIDADGKPGMQLYVTGLVPCDRGLFKESLNAPKQLSPVDHELSRISC